jgi:hypothetical protein
LPLSLLSAEFSSANAFGDLVLDICVISLREKFGCKENDGSSWSQSQTFNVE